MQLTKNQAENLLHELSPGVKIEMIKTPGVIMLTAQMTREQLIAEKFPRLIGKPITLSDASQKYGVPRTVLSTWYYRNSYIEPIDPDAYPKFFDEAQIAYLSEIYARRKQTGSKAPLLDDNGLPYELKHPELADYRRKKRAGQK